MTLTQARQKALQACSGKKGAAGQTAVRTVYERSRDIRNYVLLRAAGKCEGCGASAPFLGLDGQPYIEAHHTTRLSDGGLDHPRFVIGLCPTCHSLVHRGADGATYNKSLRAVLEVKESDL